MRMKISAICTDIDGTLLDSRRELSPRTISAIQKVAHRIPVILASSRMPGAMRHLQHELAIPHYPMICYNGGFVIQYSGNDCQVIGSIGIVPDLAREIFLLSRNTDIHVSLYCRDEWYAPRFDYWTEREERITKVKAKIAEPGEVLNRWAGENAPVHKIMCMGVESEIDTLERQLRDQYAEHIHTYRSRPTYLELAPKAVSKATALEVILQQYGIPIGEVMAFGDNYNDIEMLTAAGFGVAVANSKAEVKAVAKEVTLSSIEDGVAFSLEKHLSSC
jgi:Cof subfamily protein (haloacid dehalogenase superfamily)